MGGEAPDMNDICDTCGLRRWWHEENNPSHAFVGEEGGPMRVSEVPTRVSPPSSVTPGDLILRLALVKAGIVTEMQLTESEAWVREAARTGKALVVDQGEFLLDSVEGVAEKVATSGD